MSRLSIFKFLLALLIAFVLIGGCDQRLVRPTPGNYLIAGAAVKNLDARSATGILSLLKNDSILTTASVHIDDQALVFDVDSYFAYYPDSTAMPPGNHTLYLKDGTAMDDTISFTIPGTFSIATITPDTRLNPGGNAVQVSWLTSAGSNGYVVAAAHRDSAYAFDGYAAFVITGATSTSIPRDAFRLSGELDTGWYYIYVYAFSGAPSTTGGLPTKFPVGLTPNIARLDISGYWGGITVSRRDSMHVTAI